MEKSVQIEQAGVIDSGAQQVAEQAKELTRWKARAALAEALVEIQKDCQPAGDRLPRINGLR